jgi:integrase
MPRSITDELGPRSVTGFTFTESKVDALLRAAARGDIPTDADGRRWYRDEGCRQLQVRISRTGGGVYYRVFKQAGKRIRQRVGDAEVMALQNARAAVDRLRLGDAAPQRLKAKAGEMSIREAVEAYLDESRKGTYATGRQPPGERTIETYLDVANPHLLRPHGDKPLTWLAANFVGIHEALTPEVPAAAARLRTVVKNTFNYAIKRGLWDGRSPMIDDRTGEPTTRPTMPRSRERFLSLDEIDLLVGFLQKHATPYWKAFWLVTLYTGQRVGNVKGAAWGDIDFRGRVWRLPKTKSGRQHLVPLSDEALAAIEEWRSHCSNNPTGRPRVKWVFPKPTDPSKPLNEHRDSWEAIRRELPAIADVRPHDLRRTVGSQATIAGVPEAIVGAMLGHAPGSGATKVYARCTPAVTTEAMQAVARLMSGNAGKSRRKPGRKGR